jgi:hypothetical protein
MVTRLTLNFERKNGKPTIDLGVYLTSLRDAAKIITSMNGKHGKQNRSAYLYLSLAAANALGLATRISSLRQKIVPEFPLTSLIEITTNSAKSAAESSDNVSETGQWFIEGQNILFSLVR